MACDVYKYLPSRQGHNTIGSICMHRKSNILATVLHAIQPNQLLGVSNINVGSQQVE